MLLCMFLSATCGLSVEQKTRTTHCVLLAETAVGRPKKKKIS